MVTDLNKKKICFEYFIFRLVIWYKETMAINEENISLTRIKILKLLFFTAVIKTKNGDDLLEIFDNFYAMQHGPVESDIYNLIAANDLNIYSFNGLHLQFPHDVTEDSFEKLDVETKNRIIDSLAILRERNNDIVLYDPFKLVDLSHQWKSWKRTYEIAALTGKGSEKMSQELIRMDNQYFI